MSNVQESKTSRLHGECPDIDSRDEPAEGSRQNLGGLGV